MPQILVTPDVIEWVNSLIAQGAAVPKDATTEEKLTYQYKLNQRMKRLRKLQKSLKAEDEEEDIGVQERPMSKRRSRTRDMPPEVLGATRKDLNSGFNKQKATPTASVMPKTPQECVLQAQTYLMAMYPVADDPRHKFHQGILQGLSLAREELRQKEIPRATVASQVVKPVRQRESTGRDAEAAPLNPPRKSRYKENKKEEVDKSAARGTRRSNYEDDPKDMRSKFAQGRVDMRRQEA